MSVVVALLVVVAVAALMAFAVQRSPIGQRYRGTYPRWVVRVSRVRPPAVFRTSPGHQLAWLMRRIFPILLGVSAIKVLSLFFGTPANSVPLSTVTWVTLTAGCAAVWTAGWAFSTSKRNGPLSLWSGWIYGLGTIVAGVLFLVAITGYSAGLLGVMSWAPITGALASWASSHSIEDAVGVSITLVGLGLAILALQEAAPDIGDPSTTPADMQLRSPIEPAHAVSAGSGAVPAFSGGRKGSGANASRRRKRKQRKRR